MMRNQWFIGTLITLIILASGTSVLFAQSEEEMIPIGALYNVTGGMSSIDGPGLNGMKLAAEEINANGGVLGRTVQIISIDGETDETTVKDATSEMIETDGVVVIGGLNDSTFALEAGPIAQEASIPFATAGATLPSLPETIGDFFFMVPYGDDNQAFAVADFAVDTLGASTAYLLVEDGSDFAKALAGFFRQEFEARGGEIILEDAFKSDDTDFTTQINRLLANSKTPDVLFISSQPDPAGEIVLQFREAGFDQPILSGDGFDTPLVAQVAGDDAVDVYFSTHVALDNPDPRVVHFVEAYTEKYDHAPENAFAALGYDTMYLIADAIERAGSDDPLAIRDALAETTDFEGVTGAITYPPGERKPEKPVTIVQVQDGATSFVTIVPPMTTELDTTPDVEDDS